MRVKYLEKYLDIVKADFTDRDIRGAAVDSRLVKPDMIFFACRGNISNGNKFAQSALDNEASVVVMDDSDKYERVTGNKILVKDTMQSIYSMGAKRLNDIYAVKIAVTGSFGKTTTKEMIKVMLGGKYKVQATEGNYNNLLGVSLTACGINNDAEVVVFEVGSNAMGEIKEIGDLIKPDIALFTGFGYAHVGNFNSLAQVVYEKLTLADTVERMKTVIAHESFRAGLSLKDKYDTVTFFGKGEGADVRLVSSEVDNGTLTFTISADSKEYNGMFSYPYPLLAENFLGAFAVGLKLGVDGSYMASIAKQYEVPSGRGSIIDAGSVTIIDDAYNASLDSVTRAIENLAMTEKLPKYALIGEIREIEGYERQIYENIMEKAKENPSINFIFSGKGFQRYRTEDNIKVYLTEEETFSELDRITKGTLLVKASHSCNFEKYVLYMTERAGGGRAL